jgi:GNAT superfamily N-acetyltransferase
MDIVMRTATEDDLPGLLTLYGQLGQDDGTVLPLETARRIFARFREYPSYTVHVAELDGRLVGTFALLVMDNLGHLGSPGAVLEDVVVDSAVRGKGIGRRMMAYAHDLCRNAGCYKMTFSSNRNRKDAHRFYESLGFRRHGYSFYIEYE